MNQGKMEVVKQEMVKVNMMYRARQSGQVMVESSDKTWYTGEGNANHFSILALRTL